MTEVEARISELNMLAITLQTCPNVTVAELLQAVNERKLELAKEQPSIKENPNLCWL
jgi:hypothetical protein